MHAPTTPPETVSRQEPFGAFAAIDAWVRRLPQDAVLWAIVAFGALIRFAASMLLSIGSEVGDQGWYVGVARNIVNHGVPTLSDAPPFELALGRPPGLPVLIAPFIAIFGDAYRVPVLAAISVSSALAIYFTGRIARLLAPETPWIWLLAAALMAVSPYEIQMARYIMTEPVLTTAYLAYVLVAIQMACSGTSTLRQWAMIVALATLMMHLRLDSVLLVMGPPIAALAHSWVVRRRFPRGELVRWIGAGLAVGTLCVPFSWYASVKTGELVILAKAGGGVPGEKENAFERWMSVTMVPEPIYWEAHYDYLNDKPYPGMIDHSLFDDAAQAAEADRLFALVKQHRKPNAETEAFFDRLAKERKRKLSTWTVLPLYRIAALWYDFGPNKMHGRPRFENLRSRAALGVLETWVTGFALVFALGFTLAVLTSWRLAWPWAILSVALLTRTAGQIWTGVMVGAPLSEIRYQIPVQPLAILLAAFGIIAGIKLLSQRIAVTKTN